MSKFSRVFKRIIGVVLGAIDLEVNKMTPKEEVLKLIQQLHPIETELIRVGPNKDGGYLIPNDIVGIKACFSPGVDKMSEFEYWCFQQGMEIYLADKSVEEVNINIPKENYSFLKKFVGCTNNETYITLDKWVEDSLKEQTSDLLLQMDIEGGEYDTLISASDALMQRFRIIVIELHHLDRLWNKGYFEIIKIVLEKILQTHTCVHIHPNNCCGIDARKGIKIPRAMELSFLRKDRINPNSSYAKKFPHVMDYDCKPDKKTIILPKDWYKA